ncbi:MAG: flavodoxin [Spirochaetaceae bacterium]
MARVGIVYGSTTGNTRDVSVKLQRLIGEEQSDLIDVTETDTTTLSRYDRLIFAVSTWGAGDLQDDWEAFYPELKKMDFTGKTVAIMGLGDQVNYPEAFADAVAILADVVTSGGGRVVGHTSTEGYTYTVSKAERDGRFLGLVIDEDNQGSLTDQRLKDWVSRLRKELK